MLVAYSVIFAARSLLCSVQANGQLFQTATGFSLRWGKRRRQSVTGEQQADTVTGAQRSGSPSAASGDVAAEDDAKVQNVRHAHARANFKLCRACCWWVASIRHTVPRQCVLPLALTRLGASVCNMSDRARVAVSQEHRREAAEAASGLVNADPSAAPVEEAAPIVFLHGVGLGMVDPFVTWPADVSHVVGRRAGAVGHIISCLKFKQMQQSTIAPSALHRVQSTAYKMMSSPSTVIAEFCT